MIYEVKGNLLDSSCDYICHQVNCQGIMGAGLAGQIRTHWPEVYEEYRTLCDEHKENKKSYLAGYFLLKHAIPILRCLASLRRRPMVAKVDILLMMLFGCVWVVY